MLEDVPGKLTEGAEMPKSTKALEAAHVGGVGGKNISVMVSSAGVERRPRKLD